MGAVSLTDGERFTYDFGAQGYGFRIDYKLANPSYTKTYTYHFVVHQRDGTQVYDSHIEPLPTGSTQTIQESADEPVESDWYLTGEVASQNVGDIIGFTRKVTQFSTNVTLQPLPTSPIPAPPPYIPPSGTPQGANNAPPAPPGGGPLDVITGNLPLIIGGLAALGIAWYLLSPSHATGKIRGVTLTRRAIAHGRRIAREAREPT